MPDPTAAMQAFLAFGQSMAQGLAQLGGQFGTGAGSDAVPVSGGAELATLQKDWMNRHAVLWQAMVAKSTGAKAASEALSKVTDRRFTDPAWSESVSYDYLRQSYLLNADFLRQMSDLVPVAEAGRKRLQFLTKQFVDAMAPSNFVATNPEFIKMALDTNGESIADGLRNLQEDLQRGSITLSDEAAFEVGRNVAITPGAVVFENELIQLLQYAPQTAEVARRPLLMVPPCINKFYILDLQPENSLIRYAVEHGQTVFLVSWRNVQDEQGHLTWGDYLNLGPLKAIEVVRAICGGGEINALGFCVGGTLLTAALAVAAARGEKPVASLTLLTTLLDFSDTGEIANFVDESAVALRESSIGQGGLLRGSELSSVFSALRANDLIWSYVVGNYLKGKKPPAFDLLFWNSDATNLPGPFAAWYLRHLYLENGLRVPGGLPMCGVNADLAKLDMPVFFYASRDDHIVPWKTAYLGRALFGSETEFVLGASGHIAGVINPPSKNKRNYWINEAAAEESEAWLSGATEVGGSWWPAWVRWLSRFSGGEVSARGKLGSKEYLASEAAPGRYVKQKA